MTLTEWRKKHDLTMAQVADRLSITQPTISRIESGELWPGRPLAEKILELTDGAVTPNDFIKPAGEPSTEAQDTAA